MKTLALLAVLGLVAAPAFAAEEAAKAPAAKEEIAKDAVKAEDAAKAAPAAGEKAEKEVKKEEAKH